MTTWHALRKQWFAILEAAGRAAIALAALLSFASGNVLAEPLSAQFLGQLRQGGYIVYFRHAQTEHSGARAERAARAQEEFDLSDCSQQRNLSARGRAQAAAAGRAFRSLNIPVGLAVASRFCRTMETARLIYGEPLPADDLTPDAVGGEEGRAGSLIERLAVPPRRGTNTLIFAHSHILLRATGLSIGEGEALIFLPASGAQPYRLVWRIKIDEWAESPIADMPTPMPRPVQP